MRRILLLIATIALLLTVSVSASATSQVTTVSCYATVSSDGSCQISQSALLHLDTAEENLTVLVPVEAINVTLNGQDVRAVKAGQMRQVDLSEIVGSAAGDFPINLQYTLPDVILRNEDGTLQLQLPLLSGFAYSIGAMEFSVTLPGEITAEPAFSSGYHQADIEKDMSYIVSGASITGNFSKALKDHETLTLTMSVTEEMFPQPVVEVQDTQTLMIAVGICAALALLYWLIFLRCLPVRRQHATQPPHGFSAGQLGCILHAQGADLSLMVLTWAQHGYLVIAADRPDRVVLYKQMDMGNERSEFEQWYFRKLFGKRSAVDTTGTAYAELCRRAAKKSVGIQEMMKQTGGNLGLFRGLVSVIGLLGGMCIGLELAGSAALKGFLVFLMAVAGAVSGWLIQLWCADLHRRSRGNLIIGLFLAAAWQTLGILAGRWDVGLLFTLGLPFAGVLLYIGGRRSDLGRTTKAQVLGLRHYLKTVSKTELQRLCAQNPDYYHTLAPYALALGVGKAFAKGFEGIRIPQCPYIVAKTPARTALQWYEQLAALTQSMDARYRRLPTEKLRSLFGARK